MNKKLIVSSVVALLAVPVLSLAEVLNAGNPPQFPNIVTSLWGVIVGLLGFVWPIFVGVAILMFLISGFLFVTASGDPGKIKAARESVIWGIVGVIVGLLAFSLPTIVSLTLGI